MEFALLAKVALIMKSIVTGGYVVAGGYGVSTVIKYIQDYKDSVSRENEVR